MGGLQNPAAESETKVQALHCNTNLDDHQVIAQRIKGGGGGGGGGGMDYGRGFDREYAFNDGAQPSLHQLIDLTPNSELAKNGDADGGLKAGSAKELGEGNPTDGVAMDQELDLESGSERELETESNANAGTASFSLSSKRFFVKALNTFFIHSLKLFGIKTVEPAWLEDLCKPGADPLRSGFAACSQKSDCNNREQNPRNSDGNGKNANHHFKLSGKKPPRPPRPPRPPNARADPSKDKVIKYMLRRAKSERMTSLKIKQMTKSKSSNSSSVWALVCTLCFCVIMILQGIFSQGSGGAQISPEGSSQTNSFFVQKYDNGDAIGLDQHSISSDHFGPAPDKARSIQSDRKF